MRVTYDLPPELIGAVEGRSAAMGVTVNQYVAEILRDSVDYPTIRARVRTLWAAGKCDADIAAIVHYTPGRVAGIRRQMGLPANKRYQAERAL